ncbi:MAG: Lipoprotein-releasing system ATP-binding protein LolD [Chlamydiales bacterium]|nr:Lipoprotein-releasing system ATP-binding protein LolD [Chlamydiales bacterium]MCH9636097.1 Lipoprotein-releasing system ATP-binding protein LolD [Chlamydiales bacterium]MCH9703146.1 ABC transporter ATP-binding protein [Chlamydiota bacterium]
MTLEAKEISKVFEKPQKVAVLKSVSLSVAPGQSVAIMGASGEGKSTLLHILGTLEEPTSGSLIISGQSEANAQLRNQKIGFVFQAFNLLEDYTVLQNVLMPAIIAGREAKKRALKLLERVGLSKRANFTTKLLSGGEKQRVAIARALINDPDILLADEPSGNLDHENSDLIHTLLLECVREEGKSLVCVTHNQKLADLCDTTYHLINGELQ